MYFNGESDINLYSSVEYFGLQGDVLELQIQQNVTFLTHMLALILPRLLNFE
jgi:hypothetical protein